jgi:hypothetical protein
MNQQEKTEFVLELCDTLRDTLLERVARMPDEWDGIEIRQLMVDLAETQFVYVKMSPARKKAYKNTVLVNNLD